MNKELIKKYKKEFDWWLDGKRVVSYNTLLHEAWTYDSRNIWSCNNQDILIVIYDEYVKFRIALAEGKTIQYKAYDMANEYRWLDWEEGDSFENNYEYRVKPEEPKFKVGDFVKDINDGYIGRVRTCMNTPLSYHLDGKYPASHVAEENLELWQPKEGEWCWFYNNQNMPCLRQYCLFKQIGKYHGSKQGMMSVKVEPFIGELPIDLKR